MIHIYTPDEMRDSTAADWDDIFEVATQNKARVWKHADGSVTIATYEAMADWCDRNDGDGDDWTEMEAPEHYRQ